MMLSSIKILGEAFGVVLLALLLAGAAFIFRPSLHPMMPGNRSHTPEAGQPVDETIPTISLEDARSRFNDGTALFADARSLKAFQKGHIQGAMHLDPYEFDTWSGTFFSQIPADTLIISYCDGMQCPLSTELAGKLNLLGYENVFVLKNGWSLWKAEQLPTGQVAE